MQRDKWELEYRERQDLPSTRTTKPSRALVEFLETNKLEVGTALDSGAGNFRNSVYLAKLGYQVVAVENAVAAIEIGEKQARAEHVTDKISVVAQSLGDPLPFPDDEFDLVIDMMTLHLLDRTERGMYCSEVVRLLKPGGHFVFYTIAAESPAAQELIQKHPGPEPNSYVIPQSGMIEKSFTRRELTEMFPSLEVIKLEEKTEFTPAFGGIHERVYYSIVVKKAYGKYS